MLLRLIQFNFILQFLLKYASQMDRKKKVLQNFHACSQIVDLLHVLFRKVNFYMLAGLLFLYPILRACFFFSQTRASHPH